MIPDIISQFAKRDYVELGNIKARRDFTYVADLCEALIAVMESDIPNGQAVNVGTGTTYSVGEIARKVASIMKKPADLRTDRRRFRKYDIDLFCCDNTKLKKHTSWEPKVDLDMGLRMTIDWYMTHGKRWLWESWIEGAVVGGDGRRI